jgi:hypothetical protein
MRTDIDHETTPHIREEAAADSSDRPMRLRYGVNEARGWRHLAMGPQREQIRTRLAAIGTELVGICVFDRYTPDPLREWPAFKAAIDAVLGLGAVPVITLVSPRPPLQDASAVRWFAQRCADLVWCAVDEWGVETVGRWYWSVWNNPNSEWVSPGVNFESYRRIYMEVAEAMLRWLGPAPVVAKRRIGGPGVDTFQPFWFDWIWRFVHEIDNSLIGFVAWHQYGDWRAPGEWAAPTDERTFRDVILARGAEVVHRVEAIGRSLRGREIENICTEINVHAHHEPRVSRRFNQTLFGAVYYVSALLGLIRAGANAEMLWVGTDAGPYGLWDENATLTPVFSAKRLCTQYVRHGDQLSDPAPRYRGAIDVLVARGIGDRRSAVIVHRRDRPGRYALLELTGSAGYEALVKLDGGADGVVISRCDGEVTFNGHGVAVATTHPTSQ